MNSLKINDNALVIVYKFWPRIFQSSNMITQSILFYKKCLLSESQ